MCAPYTVRTLRWAWRPVARANREIRALVLYIERGWPKHLPSQRLLCRQSRPEPVARKGPGIETARASWASSFVKWAIRVLTLA